MPSLCRWGFLLRVRKLAGRSTSKTAMSAHTRVLPFASSLLRYLLLLLPFLKLLLPFKNGIPKILKLWVRTPQHTTQTTFNFFPFGQALLQNVLFSLLKYRNYPLQRELVHSTKIQKTTASTKASHWRESAVLVRTSNSNNKSIFTLCRLPRAWYYFKHLAQMQPFTPHDNPVS